MILTGIPAAPFLAPQTEALEQGLRRIGIRRWYPLFCKCLCMTLLLMAVTAGGYGWAVQKGYALAGREELAAWGLTCAAVSAWILLFYEVCRSSAAAILTLFAVNVVFLFLAGGIIPVRLSAGAGSESRKYDGDGALDGWNPLYCFGRGGRGGSGAVETGCGGIGMLCTGACRRKKEGLTDAEAGVVVLYVWNDAAAGLFTARCSSCFFLSFHWEWACSIRWKNGIPGGSRWRSVRERMHGIRRLKKDWNRKRAVHFSFIRAGRRKRQRRRL